MKATLTSHNRRLALVVIPCVVVVLVLLALLGQRDVLLKNQVVPPYSALTSPPPPLTGYVSQISLEADDVYARVVTPVTEPGGCASGVCTYPSAYDDPASKNGTPAVTFSDSDLPPEVPVPEAQPRTPGWSTGTARLRFFSSSSEGAEWRIEISDYPMLFSGCVVDESNLPGTFPREQAVEGSVTGGGSHKVECTYHTDLVSPQKAQPTSFSVQAGAGNQTPVVVEKKALKPPNVKMDWRARPQPSIYKVISEEKGVLQGGDSSSLAFKAYLEKGLSECPISRFLGDQGIRSALACFLFGPSDESKHPGRYVPFVYGDWQRNDNDVTGIHCTLTGATVDFAINRPAGEPPVTLSFRESINLLGPVRFVYHSSRIVPTFRAYKGEDEQSKTLQTYVDDSGGHEKLHEAIWTETVTEHLPRAYEKDVPKAVMDLLKDKPYSLAGKTFFVPWEIISSVIPSQGEPDFSNPQSADISCVTFLQDEVSRAVKNIIGLWSDAYKDPSASSLQLKPLDEVKSVYGKGRSRQHRVDVPQRGNLCLWFAEGAPRYEPIRDSLGNDCAAGPTAGSDWQKTEVAGVFDLRWPPGSGVPVGTEVDQADFGGPFKGRIYPRLIYRRTK